jgi:hypothetical protein
VRILLARVGVGLRHDPVGLAVVGVSGHDRAIARRVRVVAEGESLELLTVRRRLVGRVEIAEQVVEGSILAHEHHEMIEARLLTRLRRVELLGHVRRARVDAAVDGVPDRLAADAQDDPSGEKAGAFLQH